MRQHERARAQLTSVTEPDSEALGPHIGVDHGGVPDLDAREIHELLAPGATQLDGRHATLAEQPPDRTRFDIRGLAGVDHQHLPARPTENQSGAQASRTAPDDHRVEPWHPPTRTTVTQAPPLTMADGPS
jgi:hypothetical protein